MLTEAEDDPQFFRKVVESMECDVMDRLHSLSIKWKLEEDARASVDGEEAAV